MKFHILYRYITCFLACLFLLSAGGCFFDVYKKTNYVSQVTAVIKKNQDEINNYVELTINNEGYGTEELEKKFASSKKVFEENKIALEAIVPPKDYEDEHKQFHEAFQDCIEACQISLDFLKLEAEDATFEINEEFLKKLPAEVDATLLEPMMNKSFSKQQIVEKLSEVEARDEEIEVILFVLVDEPRLAKVVEAKDKIDNAKKLIKAGINNISIDLR